MVIRGFAWRPRCTGRTFFSQSLRMSCQKCGHGVRAFERPPGREYYGKQGSGLPLGPWTAWGADAVAKDLGTNPGPNPGNGPDE